MPEDFRLQPLDPDDTKMKNPELAFTDDVVKASFSKVNLWRLTWTLPWLTLRPLVERFSLGKSQHSETRRQVIQGKGPVNVKWIGLK